MLKKEFLSILTPIITIKKSMQKLPLKTPVKAKLGCAQDVKIASKTCLKDCQI